MQKGSRHSENKIPFIGCAPAEIVSAPDGRKHSVFKTQSPKPYGRDFHCSVPNPVLRNSFRALNRQGILSAGTISSSTGKITKIHVLVPLCRQRENLQINNYVEDV